MPRACLQTALGAYELLTDQHHVKCLRPAGTAGVAESPRDPLRQMAQAWLERYFARLAPSPLELPLAPEGTSFQRLVWHELLQIGYGKTTTYGEIARSLEHLLGHPIAAQAVGNAVARNPIRIVIPCHRVLGANGRLTGYADGLTRKLQLLNLEQSDIFS